MKPRYPISNMATFLFRKGTTATEKEFKPDGELMQEMMNRGIRVQDLIDSVIDSAATKEVWDLCEWYMNERDE